MKTLRLLLTVALVASASLWTIGCEKTPSEETKEESKAMEKAKDKAGVEPSGTKAEEEDAPIEGSPEHILTEIRREIDAYQNKIYSSSKDVPQDLRTKLDTLSAKLEKMDNEMSVDDLQAEEISEATEKQLAQLKKEWNQTKRQVDVALGTTESETQDSEE